MLWTGNQVLESQHGGWIWFVVFIFKNGNTLGARIQVKERKENQTLPHFGCWGMSTEMPGYWIWNMISCWFSFSVMGFSHNTNQVTFLKEHNLSLFPFSPWLLTERVRYTLGFRYFKFFLIPWERCSNVHVQICCKNEKSFKSLSICSCKLKYS